MGRRITIIQGHPDPGGRRFGHALADAYAHGAEQAGHAVRRIAVAGLDFPLLRSKEEWEAGQPVHAIEHAQDAIRWADHLVIVYPLWLGSTPALLKAFFEQVFRPGFALSQAEPGRMGKKLLTGKTARIIVTMGMPAFVYRWFFFAHSLRSLERNILRVVGIGPSRTSLIGRVEAGDSRQRDKWLATIKELGRGGR